MSATTALAEAAAAAPDSADHSAVTPIVPSIATAFEGPSDIFAHWRGSALQYFAGAEFAVAEALATGMARGEVMHVPADTDDRFGALASMVAEGSVWKDKGGRLRGALATYESLLPLRRALVHGLARVEALSDGGFVVRLTMMDPYGRSGRDTLFHDELESQLEALRDATRTLRDLVRNQLANLPEIVENDD